MSTVAEPEITTVESADVPAAPVKEEAPAWRMTLGVDIRSWSGSS